MDLWTIVFKLDAEEHDCIPNKWIISKERCWYPDKSKNTAIRLARENTPVIDANDWIQLRIAIVKRNFDNFERCMSDALRLNQGKRSKTESENEERGRGLRVKRTLYNTSDSEGSPEKRISPRKHTKVDPRPIKNTKPSFPLGSPKIPSPKKNTTQKSNSEPNSTTRQKVSTNYKQDNLATTSNIKNPCKVKRKHFCTFKQGPVSLESIAHGICTLSRSMTIFRGALEDIHRDVISRMPGTSNQPATSNEPSSDEAPVLNSAPTTEIEDYDGTFDDVLKLFPIANIGDFKKLDNNLKDQAYRNQVANALMSVATKTSYSRAITSILRYVLHEDIVAVFTWRGQKRWRGQKEAFASSNLSKMIIEMTKKTWTNIEVSKIEKSVASWLAQTQLKSKTKKGAGGQRASEENDDEDHEAADA